MKKTFLVLFSLFLLLSLTACGAGDNGAEPETEEYEDWDISEAWNEEDSSSDISAEDAEAQRRAIDDYLASVEDTVQTDPDKAAKMLESIPEGKLNNDQIQWIAGIKTDISMRKAELTERDDVSSEESPAEASEQDSSAQEHPVLSPEKAAEYLKKAYPHVEGDVGDALLPQYNEKGERYYSIVVQVSEDEIKTVHIYADGTVKAAE